MGGDLFVMGCCVVCVWCFCYDFCVSIKYEWYISSQVGIVMNPVFVVYVVTSDWGLLFVCKSI